MVYVEVVSGLWFGNVDMMYKPQFLSDNQIEVIINCTYQFHFAKETLKIYESLYPKQSIKVLI